MQIWNIICGAASGQWHLEFIKCLAPIPSASKLRASSSNMSLPTAILSESPSSSSYATIQVATPQEESALTSTAPAITCILPTAQSVYTGDEDGRVVSAFFLPPFYHLPLLCSLSTFALHSFSKFLFLIFSFSFLFSQLQASQSLLFFYE